MPNLVSTLNGHLCRCTGSHRIVADMAVDGMLDGFLVLPEHPRAWVLGIDTGAAEAAPGVVRILTSDGGRLTIYSRGQRVHDDRRQIAA